METRSNIGIENKDGSIETVYCHWDGYPSHTGYYLLKNHNQRESVCHLIEEGNRSSINDDDDGDEHTDNLFNEPANRYKDTKDWCEVINGAYIEFLYLFKLDGTWVYSDRANQPNFLPLTIETCGGIKEYQ